MKNDLVNLEVRFLLARYGERGVLQSIAQVRHQSVDTLEGELATLEAAKTTPVKRKIKSAEEIVVELVQPDDNRYALLSDAARLFELKRFLPKLRDVQDFLQRVTGHQCKANSRKDAVRPLLQTLLGLPSDQVQKLLDDAAKNDSTSDYQLLANQIMAGK